VILRARISYFWRHQKNSPRWYLATIESIHQFLVELHTYALGVEEDYKNIVFNKRHEKKNPETDKFPYYCVINREEIMQKYNGQYDNLLYFFRYIFENLKLIRLLTNSQQSCLHYVSVNCNICSKLRQVIFL